VAAVQVRATDVLIWFQPSGLALHTRMGVRGFWAVYPRDEAGHEPGRLARCIPYVDRWRAVCREAVVCEFLTPGQVAAHPALRGLQPTRR